MKRAPRKVRKGPMQATTRAPCVAAFGFWVELKITRSPVSAFKPR
jgi:hypothetical protein